MKICKSDNLHTKAMMCPSLINIGNTEEDKGDTTMHAIIYVVVAVGKKACLGTK